MRAVIKRVLLAVVLVVCLVYLADYLQIRYRVWRNRQPYGTVTVQILYAISEKAPQGAKRTEYTSGGTQDQACVHALFPHMGYTPCWYLSRNSQKQINI